MSWSWHPRDCHPYMVALSILRRISTTWKDVVDGTPSLWTIISATFPEDVIRASLARSGSSPIVIYFPGGRWSNTPPFPEFLQTIGPHVHRCSSLAFRIDPEVVDEVPPLSSLRLAALKIEIDLDATWMPGDTVPYSRGIEISNEALGNIRAVDFNQVPIDWRRTLEHLRNLRTLALDGVYDNTITHEHIFDVLVASPGLEALTIRDMRIVDSPSSLSPPTESISLPQLRSIIFMTDGCLTNDLMRRILPPPGVNELDIRPTNFPSEAATPFWCETMAPWFPAVQQLYVDSDRPVFHLAAQGECSLATYSEYFVLIGFKGLSMAAALQWIHDVIGPVAYVDGGPEGLQISVHGPAFEDHGVLAILQTIPGLSEISVRPVDDLTRPSLEALFNVLGQVIADSANTSDPKPSFPTLRKLLLYNWRWELDSIMDMLQSRYSMRSIYRQQIPDLSLDLSSLQLWRERRRERAIISFPDAEALRELDGVKEVRMGCVFESSGILAVIWDEEKSLPAWG
ncbi:hypothetical protein FS837_000226 [Tulasnella sp. UAMH 9824]|nr:hypothetical protein FS837_000226 [Tulasnella sp. UAMH 9824]